MHHLHVINCSLIRHKLFCMYSWWSITPLQYRNVTNKHNFIFLCIILLLSCMVNFTKSVTVGLKYNYLVFQEYQISSGAFRIAPQKIKLFRMRSSNLIFKECVPCLDNYYICLWRKLKYIYYLCTTFHANWLNWWHIIYYNLFLQKN